MAGIADEHVPLKHPWRSKEHPWWPWVCRRCRIALDILLVAALASFLIWIVRFAIDERKVTRISVDLAGIEGLNATVGRTVSPGFNLTAKVDNPRALFRWCSVGGRAVVSYGGVSLAWAPVPGFCAPKKGAAELPIAAKASGVGLSDDLRRRFVADWNAGTARVVVEMKLFYDGNGKSDTRPAYQGVSLVRRELALPGQVAAH